MADIVGLVASVITVVEVAKEAIKHEQLDRLSELMNEIDNQHGASSSAAINASLTRAKSTLTELNHLINSKLLPSSNGSRARRRAWMRYKTKVYSIRDSLKEHRENILAALSAKTLSSANESKATLTSIHQDLTTSNQKSETTLTSIHQDLMISSNKTETTLNLIDQGIKTSASKSETTLALIDQGIKLSANKSETSLALIHTYVQSSYAKSEETLKEILQSRQLAQTLNQQFIELQQSNAQTMQAMLSHSEQFKQLLASTVSHARGQFQYGAPWLPRLSESQRLLESASNRDPIFYAPNTHSASFVGTSRSNKDHDQGDDARSNHPNSSMRTPEPASPLEVSSNFFPETYTANSLLPNTFLTVIASYEQYALGDSRVNFYQLLYRKSPRQWYRLSITIDVNCSSAYWPVTKIPTHDSVSPLTGAYLKGSLPVTLIKQLQEILFHADTLEDDLHIQLSLTNQDPYHPLRVLQIGTTRTHSSTCDSFTGQSDPYEVISFLEDLGCPKALESQTIQVATLSARSYLSLFEGKLVVERKISGALPGPDELHTIQVLQCMQGVSGFPRLVAISLDASRKHLKGFLVERSRTRIVKLAAMLRLGRLVPWSRREKLAWGLIDGYRQVHSKSLVVGAMSPYWFQVEEATNHVRVTIYRKKFNPGSKHPNYYPPEFRYCEKMPSSMSAIDCPNITPKADIFWLGLTLWYVAEGISSTAGNRSAVCVRDRCNPQKTCDDSHMNPTTLPPLPEGVPRYYRDIVDAARAEDPLRRPPAWKLLSMFPLDADGVDLATESSEVVPPDDASSIGQLVSSHSMWFSCDHCEAIIMPGHTLFHCDICSSGNYDICISCYDKGIHCRDPSHMLVEQIRDQNLFSDTGRYCSSVQSSGERNILSL